MPQHKITKQRRIFLDYASTTPIDPVVMAEMEIYYLKKFGNPSSLHQRGQEARIAVDDARDALARFLKAKAQEIIFTSCASEANNFVLRSVSERIKREYNSTAHIAVSAVEHPSVMECANQLEKEGKILKSVIPVTKSGTIDVTRMRDAVRGDTALVSVQYANSEIGAIQPLPEIRKIIEDIRAERIRENSRLPLFFHTDAVQAANFLDCSVCALGVDYLTLSGHKIFGPKGVGALFVRTGSAVYPLLIGGSQEFGIRSGTENVPAIAGMGKAIERIYHSQSLWKRIQKERDYLAEKILAGIPGAEINGDPDHALPNIVNIHIPDIPGESLLIALDQAGIEVSLGTACSTRALKPSPVIMALGYPKERAKSSIRISIGRYTTHREILNALPVFVRTAATLRQADLSLYKASRYN